MFLVATASLALGILAAMLLITDFLFGGTAAVVCVAVLGAGIVGVWYVLPLTRGRAAQVREEE
jgi:hypothetical protein